MKQNIVEILNFKVSNKFPLFLIAGPCCIESKDHAINHAGMIKDINGIIVPGGFGERGSNGKINAIKYARLNNIPFFGICFGMQMAVIEFARNVLNMKDASSSEFGITKLPLVGLLTEWQTKTG